MLFAVTEELSKIEKQYYKEQFIYDFELQNALYI